MSAQSDAQSSNSNVSGEAGAVYRNSALVLLTVIYIFNFLDRQILNILAESVRTDLNLSDSQLGLVTGLAFALFYSSLGLPIARYAERGDRPFLLAIALSIWSIFTILCGMAQNFLQLILARIGVGVGEAGGVPPSHSLITEFTPRNRRALALAIFSMGIPLGSFFGFALGGVLGDAVGWRMAFVIAGVPGLFLAAFAAMFLREPRRQTPVSKNENANLWRDLSAFAHKPTYRWMAAGGALQALVVYGSVAFLAPFFLRAHGTELTEVAKRLSLEPTGFLGIAFGLAIGLCGAVGTFGGGWIADKLRKGSLKSYARVPAVASFISVPLMIGVFLTPSPFVALVLLGGASMMLNSYFGPMHGVFQSIVSPQQRATISALTLVIINLVGLGIGPPLVGMISDLSRAYIGMSDADALRIGLILISCIPLFVGVAFLRAGKTVDAEIVA